MALKLVGRFESEFEAQDHSGKIRGVNLHCIETEEDPRGGLRVERLYIHERRPGYLTSQGIPFGSIVTPVYNRYGKVDDLIWKSPDTVKQPAK